MTRLEYILERLHDAQLRNDMAKVVADVDALIPHSEDEFSEILKFGLYPAGQCVPFVTKQGTPFYQLDNMAMVPKGDTANYLRYGDFEFRQLEVLYNMARMDSAEAHHWLKDNLFQGCRVDARKKTEYNSADVEVLNLQEELPEVYRKLEESICEAAVEAERHHWLLGGFYEGAYEYDVYEVMEYCEENCGFEFIYDEEEYMDEDGELDEDALEDARQEAFDEWLPDYLEMLDIPECCAFIEEQLNGEVEVDDELECEVFIPDEIIKLAGL